MAPLDDTPVRVHPFRFGPGFRLAALPFGVHPDNARIEVTGTHLVARFGPWRVTTSTGNIARAEVTGPYALPKVLGPAHLSLRDRGLTFATNHERGVCLGFVEPVRGIDPWGWVRHPGLTVTVADPDALVQELVSISQHADSLVRDEHAALDAHTTSELRALGTRLGLRRVSTMRKADLVQAILDHDDLAAAALRTELDEQRAPHGARP